MQSYSVPFGQCRIELGLNIQSSYAAAKAAVDGNSDAVAFAVVVEARQVAWFPANEREYNKALGKAIAMVHPHDVKVIGTTYGP